MAPPKPHPPFFCIECEYTTLKSGNLRRHFNKYHKEGDKAALERHILEVRHPEADFDELVQRYKDKLETVWTIKRKGYRLLRYLRELGVLRRNVDDSVVERILQYGSASPKKNPKITKTMLERYGTIHPMESEICRTNYTRNFLRKQGLEDLLEPILLLKKIKKIMASQAEANKKTDDT